MLTYEEMRHRIACITSIQYFTKEFYLNFILNYRNAINNIISHKQGDAYTTTKESLFYTDNGFAYCIFLEIFHSEENLQKYSIRYSTDVPDGIESTLYDYAENEETATALASARMKMPFKYVTVSKVA